MARPRTHDLDSLLDAAERLVVDKGSSGLTIRALTEATGASSGTLYHAFGSREDLLGRMWLRAARRFLDAQNQAADLELSRVDGTDVATRATVAVASVPDSIKDRYPSSAAVLLRYRRDEILGRSISDSLRSEIESLDGDLLAVLSRLSQALWDRQDRAAIETVALCVVDLPTAILINRRERIIDPLSALEAAVRGVLADGPVKAEGRPQVAG